MATRHRERAAAKKTSSKKAIAKKPPTSERDVDSIVAWLERTGTKAGQGGMKRYAIPSDKAFGVSVGALKSKAKNIGTNHDLAAALWDTGWYEARMLALFVDEASSVTAAQMESWCRAFDNWSICDTACFALFDRTPHAWAKVDAWARSSDEFVKRASFALIWSLTVHDKEAPDASFERALKHIERAATDERNFVKKAVNMALRAVGKRNAALNSSATTTARRLAASKDATAAWVGKDALRELTSDGVLRRLGAKAKGER